ncbi:MAG: cation transporter, partial [Rhodocyclaceae bacterium]|nr:cation transporter [Rhodocyclaceae bacterium]
RTALSAHVVLRHMDDWDRILPETLDMLRQEFKIEHATLQPEVFVPALYAISDPDPGRNPA